MPLDQQQPEHSSSVCLQDLLTPLSYAQIVSPAQQGVKRTTSEREALSPVECCPKRTIHSLVEVERGPVKLTPCHTANQNSPNEETPDDSLFYSKANSGGVQRRLFASPKQPTPTRYAGIHVCS